MKVNAMKIGVLALQGDFREHRLMLQKLGVDTKEIRLPKDLDGLNGLIIPGGESTTMGKLMVAYGLDKAIKDFYQKGGAIWGTCAGAILLATDIESSEQPRLGLLPMTIARNAFGRQVDSFEADLDIKNFDKPFKAVFIRAPIIKNVGVNVEILARNENNIVLAQNDRLLASSFHPELTNDDRLHRFFLEKVLKK